jgi:hypothetical protein
LIANYSSKENIPLQINLSTLGQFAVSVAAMSVGISLLGVIALVLPMTNRLSSTDRKIHSWLLKELTPIRTNKIFSNLKTYFQIHATIVVGFVGFWVHILLSPFEIEIAKFFILFLFISAIIYQARLVYRLSKKRDIERSRNSHISDARIDDINTVTIFSHIYMIFFSSFVWFLVVTMALIAITGNFINENTADVIEQVLVVSVPIVMIAGHSLIWFSSSLIGPKLFYGIIFSGFLIQFVIYPGATQITKNTLQYMGIGGGIQVEILLQEPEFLAISKLLNRDIGPDNNCPCSTGKIELVLDLGDMLYIRPIDASTKEETTTLALRRNSIVSITYYEKTSSE